MRTAILISHVHNSILRAGKRVEHHAFWIGLVGLFGFMFYYWLWVYVIPQPYDSFWLRCIASLLCFFVMIKEYWPIRLHPFFPYFWCFTLWYSLPFLFTHLLLMNNFSHMWMTSLLMGIFLTILLVDWISLLLLWTIGPLIALSAVFILGHDIKVNYGVIEDFLLFPFAIMAGVTFRYLTDRETKEKLHGILAAGGSIAHELRTPLLGIKSGVAGLKRYLPALFDGYELAKNHGLPVKKIRKAHYDALFPVLDRIEDETDYSNVIIDMLLMNAGKQKIDDQSFEWCSMRNTVKEAIERYPFGSEVEQNKVLFDDGGRDFMYKGSTTLMVHVLFNLLKNALYFISKAQKGVVTIRIEGDSSHHMLLFKDTGTGIPHNVLPHIFQRFYSSTEEGTGIGLSYCYRVVKSFGGHINCRSKEGAFTEFVLRFPKGEH